MFIYIERDEESLVLDRALREATGGVGSVIVMDGPPGCGKSSLLRDCSDRAEAAGMQSRVAVASAAERPLPLGVIEQLFPGVAADIDEYDPDQHDFQVLRKVRAWLEELGRRSPVLIAVDDVQHADEASLRCLLFLARRLRSSPVVVVLAESGHLMSGNPEFQAELHRLPYCRRITLRPLSRDGVARLLDELADAGATDGSVISGELAAECHEISGGNPRLVHSLIRDRMVPDGAFRKAVLSLLFRDEPAALRLLRSLAVLGEASPPAVLSSMAGVSDETTARLVSALEVTGLLKDGRFRHPVSRWAIMENLTATELAELNRRAALLLYAEGAGTARVAEHIRHAGVIDDAAWGVSVLRESAESALADGRAELALDYLGLAHNFSRDQRERATLKAAVAGISWQLNPSTTPRHLPELISATRCGHLPQRDALGVIALLLWHGRYEEAVDALHRLGGPIGADTRTATTTRGLPGPAATRAQDSRQTGDLRIAYLSLAATYPGLLGRVQHASSILAGKDLTAASPVIVDPWLQGAALLATVLTRGADESTVMHAEQVLERCRPGDPHLPAVEPYIPVLYALVYADQLDVAARWCDRLLADERVAGSPVWQAQASAVRAEIALRQGDLREAGRYADLALAEAPEAGWGVGIGMPLSTAILAAVARGRFEEVAEHLARPVAEAVFQTRYGVHYLYARGHAHMATGRHYAALADFLSCGELLRGWGLDLPGLVPWRSAAAQAWLALGDRDQARQLVNEQLARLGADNSRARGVTLRQLAATSAVNQRPQILSEAVEILESRGDRHELAWGLADLSRALHAMGQRSRARMIARRCWTVAEECEAKVLIEQIQPDRGRFEDGGDTDPDGRQAALALSDAERRVAALAARGQTNREIASKLFITVSTVEQHLTQVYRKLNVKHRRELPRGLDTLMGETA
nr:RsnR [Streptomyces sp.]